ncbi:MAG: cob(I)yrinic acid a,c-diamide adenosyltransferase [Tissierellia bacterium]|nr:cob(I)yrinic acid a,c-diamide adenosyltransferase [Tissierellia bacterium]
MDKAYVQIYTGNGKGKTTAALGISLRSVCAGRRVFFGQFIKGMDYSELKAPDFLPGFELKQFGRDCFIRNNPTKEDIAMAKNGFEEIKSKIMSEEYDLVVMDELNIAIFFELIEVEEVLELIDKKPEKVELIITGRYAPKELIEAADLVTEMKEIKHYYTAGVPARIGIEY